MISFGSSRNVQGKKLVCVLAAMTIAVLIGLRRGNGYAVLRRGSSSTVEDEEEEGQSVMELAPVLVDEGRQVVVPMRHTFLRGGDDTIMSEELFAPSIYGMMFTKELLESRNIMVLASDEEEEGQEEDSEEEADGEPIPQDLH